jgi:hypothetical protein
MTITTDTLQHGLDSTPKPTQAELDAQWPQWTTTTNTHK